MEGQNSEFDETKTKQCPYCYERIHEDAVKCRYCRSTFGSRQAGKRKRGEEPEKIILGVCAGLAARYVIPVTAVRFGFVLLSLFHGFGILLYFILWAVLPGTGEEEAKVGTLFKAFKRIFEAAKKALKDEIERSKKARTTTGEGAGVGKTDAVESH